MENGQTKLTTDRLRDVARILGFKPEQVINFHEESFFTDVAAAQKPFDERADTKCQHCGQWIRYLEGEVKFLRHLVNKMSGVSA